MCATELESRFFRFLLRFNCFTFSRYSKSKVALFANRIGWFYLDRAPKRVISFI